MVRKNATPTPFRDRQGFMASTPLRLKSSRFRPPEDAQKNNMNTQRTDSNNNNNPRTSMVRSLPKRKKRRNVFMIPRACFARLVREIVTEVSIGGYKWHVVALCALQEASEVFLTQLMEDAALASIHAKRVTLMIKDIHLVRRIQRLQL